MGLHDPLNPNRRNGATRHMVDFYNKLLFKRESRFEHRYPRLGRVVGNAAFRGKRGQGSTTTASGTCPSYCPESPLGRAYQEVEGGPQKAELLNRLKQKTDSPCCKKFN
jgi:hypothetical protein